MQSRPRALGGRDASSSALNDAGVHQQGDAFASADAMAHWFGSPHSGQEEAAEATDILVCFYCTGPQPLGLKTRSAEAGNFASLLNGRRGRATSSPPQLGHCPASTPLAHDSQNVHSKEQMRASVESGARSRLQHSQFGFS